MAEAKEIAERLISFRQKDAARLHRLGAYYRGQHDILRAPRDPLKPDNRLVNGFCRSITDCTVGYFMGRGVSYSAEDKKTEEMVRRVCRRNGERTVNNSLARDLSVYGRAAEILFYETVGDVRFTPIPVTSVFPVYDDSVLPRLRYAVRFYREDGCEYETVEIYEPDVVTRGRFDGRTFFPERETPHCFGGIPIIFYDNNREKQGDFEPVLSLVDAYDRLQSDSVNDFALFADSYLAISGMGATDAEDIARIRRDRVILLEDGGDAKWLTKTVNDEYIEHLKERIARDIYRFSGTVDMAEETLYGNNLSGVAIRYRLLNFENRVAVTEQYFRRALTARWRRVCDLLNLTGEQYDASSIRMQFIRNLPGMPEEAADMAQKLTGILSRRTVVEQLPMVDDAAAEMKRIQEEEHE